jgi:hypothetical protein
VSAKEIRPNNSVAFQIIVEQLKESVAAQVTPRSKQGEE